MQAVHRRKSARLALIEDNIVDRIRTIKALTENAQLLNEIDSYDTAELAMAAFADEHADPPKVPDLILLDLNLPGISGHQFLSLIKLTRGYGRSLS